ncbi:MAG: VWA domain-containing protein [Candidatus Marinimicrobia bacterium]|nr:VWA domain-containing protein [Candidatus Neomarinimicrobiota bacterium]
MLNLEFLRPLDIWSWGGLLVIGIVLIIGFRSIKTQHFVRFLFTLRLGVFAICLALLSQPKLTVRNSETHVKKWNLYLDNSLSMDFHQNFSLAAVNNGITELINEFIRRDIDLETFGFSQDITELAAGPAIEAVGSSTNLGNVISHINALDENNYSGAIIITDGQPTQGTNPGQLAVESGIPIFTIGIGDTTPMVDISISSIDVPTVAIKGDDLTLTARIASIGPVESRVSIMLMHDGEPIGSRFITVYGQNSQQQVRFQFTPQKLGKNKYKLVASSVADEINIKNNRQDFEVTMLKDRYEVALVTGAPNYNTTLIKSLLNKQSRISLQHFIQKNIEFSPPIKMFWETKYDLIIFDNFPTQQPSRQWQRIFARKLSAQQSSLAWVIGPDVDNNNGQPLFPFFHLRSIGDIVAEDKTYNWYFTEDFTTSPLAQGFNSNDLSAASQLPPITPGIQVESLLSDMAPLAYLSGPVELPLIIYNEQDGLRSFIWTAPGYNQLHYKLSGTKFSLLAEQLWTGIVGWLLRISGAEKLYFRLNKDVYQQGEMIAVTGKMAEKTIEKSPDTKAFIRVMQNGTQLSTTELEYSSEFERWEGELWAAQPGQYQFEIVVDDGNTSDSQTGMFSVSEGQIELNKVFVNRNTLQQVADNSEGSYYDWNTRFNLNELLEQEHVTTTSNQIIKFGEEYFVLIILLLFLVIEWIIRRRFGLQ